MRLSHRAVEKSDSVEEIVRKRNKELEENNKNLQRLTTELQVILCSLLRRFGFDSACDVILAFPFR